MAQGLPFEVVLIRCVTFLDAMGLAPKSLTISAERYIDALNSIGDSLVHNDDGDITFLYEGKEIKIVCEDV